MARIVLITGASRGIGAAVDRWRELLDVNVIGAFVCAREAVRRMSTRMASYITGTIVDCSGGR